MIRQRPGLGVLAETGMHLAGAMCAPVDSEQAGALRFRRHASAAGRARGIYALRWMPSEIPPLHVELMEPPVVHGCSLP